MIAFEFFRDLDQLYIHESSGEHGQLLSECKVKKIVIRQSFELFYFQNGMI